MEGQEGLYSKQRCLPLDGGKNAIGRAARAVVIVSATPWFVPAAIAGCLARRGMFYYGWFRFFYACGEFRALRGATRDAVSGLCHL